MKSEVTHHWLRLKTWLRVGMWRWIHGLWMNSQWHSTFIHNLLMNELAAYSTADTARSWCQLQGNNFLKEWRDQEMLGKQTPQTALLRKRVPTHSQASKPLLLATVDVWPTSRAKECSVSSAQYDTFTASERFRTRSLLHSLTLSHQWCRHLEQTSTNIAPSTCWEALHLCATGPPLR